MWNYVINFNTDLIDGKYNIFAEDDAGNISDITNDQTFLIDRTLPILPKILLSDNTDTGRSTVDLLTNLAKPKVTFTTESGLRVFVQENPGNSSKDLVLDTDYEITKSTDGKTYTVSFLKDLKDFDYVISVKDDAGNQNAVASGSKDEIFR